jgi:hypothetical protein
MRYLLWGNKSICHLILLGWMKQREQNLYLPLFGNDYIIWMNIPVVYMLNFIAGREL